MDPGPAFVIFGSAHIIALLIVAVLCFMTPLLVRQLKACGWSDIVARIMASLIVSLLVIKIWWLGFYYDLPWQRLLPLQICDANVILCALMLVLRNYRLYEVAYFWAMAGSVAAMLTPDIPFGFPHPIFISFYLEHGLAVIIVLYASFAYHFRPRWKSVIIALVITSLYALVIMVVNGVLGTNYLYLSHKPAAPSLLDYFGPWPWYVVGLVIMAVVAFLVCYAPIALFRYFRK